MMKKHTNDVFIQEASKKHLGKYDYSHSVYKNGRTKIKIICPIHGLFNQQPRAHLSGRGCCKCAIDAKAKTKLLTTDKFIAKAIEIHGNKYDYSNSEYLKSELKIDIICPIHGLFSQKANNHLRGTGCAKCSAYAFSFKNFVEQARNKHNDKYHYSLVKYVNNHTKVQIICKKHGIFQQKPNVHLRGRGCPKCVKTHKLTTKVFAERSTIIHDGIYLYDFVEYTNNHTKVKIICKKHGVFLQRPHRHLRGEGCPFCNMSKGEKKIKKYLINHNLEHTSQYTNDNCRKKNKLPFDFSVFTNNELYLIEFFGEQHYKLVNFSKNKNRAKFKFEQTKENDKIKSDWCLKNNVKLCVIPYWDIDSINCILDEFLNLVQR